MNEPHPHPRSPTPVIALVSASGGVGKTTLASRLALTLARRRRRVLLFDGVLGAGAAHTALGVSPRVYLEDAVSGRVDLRSVAVRGPGGMSLIPTRQRPWPPVPRIAHSGIIHGIGGLLDAFDVMLVDTGPGFSPAAVDFAAAADQVLLVVRDDLASVQGAQWIVKVLSEHYAADRFAVVVNRARSDGAAREVYQELVALCETSLAVRIADWGSLLEYPTPRSDLSCSLPPPPEAATERLSGLADRLIGLPVPLEASGRMRFNAEQVFRLTGSK